MLTQDQYQERVAALTIGKQLPDVVYIHVDALVNEDKQLFDFANAIANVRIPAIAIGHFGLIRSPKSFFFSSSYFYSK